MELTEEIPPANQRKLQWILYGIMLAQFIYSLFLPENWQEYFGFFARPIMWAAQHIPAVEKIILIAKPDRPNIVYGVLGLTAYIPLFYSICFMWYGIFDCTDPNNIRIIVGKPGYCRIYGKKVEPINDCYRYHKKMSLTYKLVYIFSSICIICFFYTLPYMDRLFCSEEKFEITGDKQIDYIICIYFCTIYTWLVAKLTANPLAFFVDTLVDRKRDYIYLDIKQQ